MAHQVYEINGEDSMAYVEGSDKPWHGLGQTISPDSPLEVWAKTAHLDWTVEASNVHYQTESSDSMIELPTRKVLYRSDNEAPLSVVSNRYKIVQPSEVLEFFRELIDNHGFKMNTAGSLDNGRRIWALADIGKTARIMGQDEIHGHLLLATSYDLTLATTAMFTAIRVVCNNTLNFAYGADNADKKSRSVKVSHFSLFDSDKIHYDLGMVTQSWDRFERKANEMAEKAMTEEQAVKFFTNVLHNDRKINPKTKEPDYSDVSERTLGKIMAVYDGGVGQNTKSAKNTLWGAVNAVTRYYDHEKNQRKEGSRLNAAWFGYGANNKNRAWDLADGMLKAA